MTSPRVPSVSKNSGAAIIGAGASVGTALVVLPLILNRVGLEAYGIWAIGQIIVTYATVLGAGLGPTVQRYAAVADGSGDLAALTRLFWLATAVYIAGGAALILLVAVLAPTIVALFSVPAHLQRSAETMVRLLAVAAALALYSGCLVSFLQGLRRYVAANTTALIAALAFLGAVAVALGHHGIGFLALLFVCARALAVVLQLVAVRRIIFAARPSWPNRAEAKALGSFTVRMQVLPLSTLINMQSDRLILALVASPTVVGEYAIGAQVAVAINLIGATTIGPMGADLAYSHGAGAGADLIPRYIGFQRRFITLVVGTTVLASIAFGPILSVWLHRPTGLASVFGVITLIAFACNLVTGPSTMYLRATGQPQLEARYGLVIISANVLLTVVCAFAFGKIGVVAGTLGAYGLAVLWFFTRLPTRVPGGTSDLVATFGRALAIVLPLGIAFAFATHAITTIPSRAGAGATLVALGLVCLAIFLVVADPVDDRWFRRFTRGARAWLTRVPPRRARITRF